jgi:uncharacterized protein YjdB
VLAPADHSNDCAHVYEYRALDAASNASATGTCTVNIDTTAPTCVAPELHDQLTGWTTTDRLVAITADDGAGSGVAAVYYTLDGGGQTTMAAPSPSPATGSTR